MIVRGIDTDNYDGEIPVSHFQRLHDVYGVRFDIVGLEAMEPFARSQVDNAAAAGIQTPFAYKFLYWTDDDLERMKQAAAFGLPVAIDCETATTWAPERVVERIQQAKDVLLAEGRYWGIYTGEWWWPSNTRNSHEFANDRLWHAAYPFNRPGQPPVLPPQDYLPPAGMPVRYGGWGQANVHQYADICYEDAAWHLDMNAADESILVAPQPDVVVPSTLPPPPDPTLEFRPGAWGQQHIAGYLVTFVDGVPVERLGGTRPGMRAKNFGGEWRWLINKDGNAEWSATEGD